MNPTPLPGWSGVKFVARGGAMEGLVPFCAVAISFESMFGRKWYYWGGFFGILSGIFIGIGLTMGIRGYSKLRREREAGYTTALPDAEKYPELFLLNPVTFAVISPPYAPRPETLRRFFKIRDLFIEPKPKSGR
jgi:hypothetical protein